MFLGFTNTNINKNHKLLSLSNSVYYFSNIFFFGGNIYHNSQHYFLENRQNSTQHLFCKLGEIQVWLNKNDYFTSLILFLIRIMFSITYSLDSDSVVLEQMSFTKLKKKRLMITHVINKVIIKIHQYKIHHYSILLWGTILWYSIAENRSSRSQMFFKIGALKNFASFTRKHPCWSLFLIKLHV